MIDNMYLDVMKQAHNCAAGCSCCCGLTSAGLAVTGTFGVVLIQSIAVFFMLRRSVRLHQPMAARQQPRQAICWPAAVTRLSPVPLLNNPSCTLEDSYSIWGTPQPERHQAVHMPITL